MADASQLQLNPYALFDPSQWTNPYSNYQHTALPAASYAGWPTDAMGNPIQPTAGMTINQTPQQPTASPAASAAAAAQPQAPPIHGVGGLQPGQWDASNGLPAGNPMQFAHATDPSGMPYGQTSLGRGVVAPSWQPPQMQQAQPQAAAAAPASSGGLTPQQYMQLRANPGPIPTYGANVPQSTPGQAPGAGVLQSFLQNWKPASSGVGSGFQQGFAQALKNQGYRTS